MARTSIRERPDREEVLWPVQKSCPACGHPMRLRYDNCRTLVTLAGPVRLRLKIRRCERDDCSRHRRPYRPEAEGAIALPEHEFGLDVIALVGTLRHREHRSVPEIHQRLCARGVAIAERSVTNLLDRYDELLAVSLSDSARLRRRLAAQGRVILALDGLQPDVGHEVLWVIRECISGEVLLARSLLSGTAGDLVALLREVARAVGVPVAGLSGRTGTKGLPANFADLGFWGACASRFPGVRSPSSYAALAQTKACSGSDRPSQPMTCCWISQTGL